MPAKNVAKYIGATLESIQAQTESEWELIIVNDHSEDYTQDIIDSFIENDSRISSFLNDNLGIVPALLLAYKKSSGDLITRMDADDLMEPKKLELLKNKLILSGKGFVATGLVNYFSEGTIGNGFLKYADWLNGLTLHENNYNDIYRECVIPSPSWMMFRSDLERIGGIANGTYPEDYDLCFRMKEHDLTVCSIPEVIHQWRDYPERTSRNDPNYADNRFFDLKLNYFLKLELKQKSTLVLLGAGKKAKLIAKTLLSKGVRFKWLTNNKRKIGHDIYGVILESNENIKIDESSQIIVAISNPIEQKEIRNSYEIKGLRLGRDFFFFC